MTSTQQKDPVLVVIQLTGGNDFMNTLIPYANGIYYDNRPYVCIPQDKVLPMNDEYGFHPSAARLKEMFDAGDVAIIQGVGYPNASRSHFRGMDIIHTCEPDRVVTEGWGGKVVRDLDPMGENPLTGVSFGRGLPRAMTVPGVPVTSVASLENFGLMTSVQQQEREQNLDIFKRIYTPAVGAGLVNDYLAQTARDVLRGADMLKDVPSLYSSTVEYAANPIAQQLRDVARVHTAGLGTRLFYTQHGGYDHHSQEPDNHARLLEQLSGAISDFMADLREHNAAEEVAIVVFTEFGRRIKDNGSGTDHGSGGGSFIIGERVNGGLYSEYPSIEYKDWLNGEDMKHNIDFRGVFGTVVEQWLGLDPDPIVCGKYEQVYPFKAAPAA